MMLRYLCYLDRLHISDLYLNNWSLKEIATEMDVSLTTLYRELNRGYTGRLNQNGVPEYDAIKAQQVHVDNLKRRGRKKGAKNV